MTRFISYDFSDLPGHGAGTCSIQIQDPPAPSQHILNGVSVLVANRVTNHGLSDTPTEFMIMPRASGELLSLGTQ